MEWIRKNLGALLTVVLATLFAVVASLQMEMDQGFVYALVPLAFVMLWLLLHHIDLTLLLVAFATPFAINMKLLADMELSMPSEPLLILFTVLFLFRVLLERNYDRRLLRHPVSLLVLAMLAWMTLTSVTSAMPLVSFKYTLARTWFVVPCFFAAAQIFSQRRRIPQFVVAYALGLAVIVVIATYKTLSNFSDLQTLHRVMRPFYNDHTAYGCALALTLPVTAYLAFARGHSRPMRWAAAALTLVLAVGLYLSYCRAAWIGIVGALGVWAIVRTGMKPKWMITLFLAGVGGVMLFQGEVMMSLGRNHQDSSYELSDQLRSITNVSTDASNLERLNRWACAFRMWAERPVTGYGPGTYQFLYGAYQKSYQLTTISTNAGDLGNAHSEYIGPLADQGLPGSVIMLLLFVVTFSTGVKVYRTAKDPASARLALALTLALITYYIHGLFNNFLDTDKLSVPFWAMTAAVVSLDVFAPKTEAS